MKLIHKYILVLCFSICVLEKGISEENDRQEALRKLIYGYFRILVKYLAWILHTHRKYSL